MDPRRMEQWTDDDFREVKNAVDQMFTALETYTAALLQKAPLWDNSPNIGTFISGNLRDLGDATLDEGGEQGKEDSSSDEDEDRASGRSRIRAVRYHTPLKCMPLHLAVIRCLQAWTPPPPPGKSTWDLVKEVLSPRMVALVVTNGVSEQVAGLFGADAEAGQRMISRGEDSSKAKFWMHW
ncbi:hypothetical protein ANOM_003700 [Aspergillus nomiae NRRL 13137]|uniref:Uncharacterized protein n=1 Tax=Aspergillus nomiae NRRL (strain ATCC 15546 / NRRL 13137 / CBS 260.88 / M93) TaxID=1509407 RepID=A0A0L1JAW3_ASPN3|nr:uncharacterized protein ANOM_003700 [Aspergillus nomiae NRRL 13137]KNG88850.1 hypothetical protein ANOM_003700 [Aspergillus nomiae NRRL 13137]